MFLQMLFGYLYKLEISMKQEKRKVNLYVVFLSTFFKNFACYTKAKFFHISQIFPKTKAFFSHSPMSDGYFEDCVVKKVFTFSFLFMIQNISSVNTFFHKKTCLLIYLFTFVFLLQ